MSSQEEFAVDIQKKVCHSTRERTNYILAQPMGRDCGGPRKAKHSTTMFEFTIKEAFF